MLLSENLNAIASKIATLVVDINQRCLSGQFGNVELHTEVEQLVSELMKMAINEGQLQALLFDIADHPENYLQNRYGTVCLVDALSECGCFHPEGFHRLYYPRRQAIEKQVVDFCKTVVDANKPFQFVSLGCGNHLQDLLLMIQLLQQGITRINLILIEPKENPWQLLDFLFGKLNQESKGKICIDVTPYSTVQGYLRENHPSPDIVSAIDAEFFYSKAIDDVALLQKKLQANSMMFVSVFHHDFAISSNSFKLTSLSKQAYTQWPKLISGSDLGEKRELSIAFVIHEAIPLDYFYDELLALPAHYRSLKKVNIVMAQPIARTIKPQTRGVVLDKITPIALHVLQIITAGLFPNIEFAIEYLNYVQILARCMAKYDIIAYSKEEDAVILSDLLMDPALFFTVRSNKRDMAVQNFGHSIIGNSDLNNSPN